MKLMKLSRNLEKSIMTCIFCNFGQQISDKTGLSYCVDNYVESVDFSGKVDKLSKIRLLQGREKSCKTSCKICRLVGCVYVNYVPGFSIK